MKILIKNLKFKTIIGLLKKERKKAQTVIINIEVKSKKFIDYSILSNSVMEIYKKSAFLTVENSLNETTKILKKEFSSIKMIKIKILKPKILKNASVGASLKTKY